jgi:hypothetical protein
LVVGAKLAMLPSSWRIVTWPVEATLRLWPTEKLQR